MRRTASGTAGTGTLAVCGAGGAGDLEADLPGAGGHEPERAGEEGGSAAERFIASAVGGCFEASPVSGRA